MIRSNVTIGGVIILALAGYLIFGRGGANGPPARTIPVTIAKPTRQDVPVYLNAVGNVQAANSVLIRVRVDGEIKRIAFEEGQFVNAGDLLAEIDSRSVRTDMEQAEAQRAKDESLLANARSDLERVAKLAQRDFASRQSIDTQRSLVAQLEAQLRGDLAKIESARVQLSYTRITAPIAGRLGARLIDQGNIVRAADATGLVTIKQIEPAFVTFNLPEQAYPVVAAAQKAHDGPLKVRALRRDGPSGADKDEHEGDLSLVNNEIDQTSGTVLMKAQFSNTDHALWPGQFVNVRLVLETLKNALIVPSSVIVQGPDGPFAYVVGSDNVVAMRPLSIVQNRDGMAVVASGLDEGETVVSDGQYRLRPGAVIAPSTSGSQS